MRLEDWQKFIESQFLEEGEAKPSLAAAEVNRERALPLAEALPNNASPKAADTLSVNKPESVQLYPSFLNSPKQVEQETTRTEPLVAKSVRSPFVPVTLLEEEIPEFGTYLPSYAVIETSVETLAEIEPTPTSLAINFDESAQTPAQPSAQPKPSERRIPKSRARHLRNTPELQTVKEMSPAELWAGIPKYLETLLAMERTDSSEVAQFSYKSPFLEKRRELIHRLLDPELSIEETARLLCVCPTTVRRYTNRGILRCYRKEVASGRSGSARDYDTRQRRFRLSDILHFLETQGDILDKDRRHDAETLFAPSVVPVQHSQESEL